MGKKKGRKGGAAQDSQPAAEAEKPQIQPKEAEQKPPKTEPQAGPSKQDIPPPSEGVQQGGPGKKKKGKQQAAKESTPPEPTQQSGRKTEPQTPVQEAPQTSEWVQQGRPERKQKGKQAEQVTRDVTPTEPTQPSAWGRRPEPTVGVQQQVEGRGGDDRRGGRGDRGGRGRGGEGGKGRGGDGGRGRGGDGGRGKGERGGPPVGSTPQQVPEARQVPTQQPRTGEPTPSFSSPSPGFITQVPRGPQGPQPTWPRGPAPQQPPIQVQPTQPQQPPPSGQRQQGQRGPPRQAVPTQQPGTAPPPGFSTQVPQGPQGPQPTWPRGPAPQQPPVQVQPMQPPPVQRPQQPPPSGQKQQGQRGPPRQGQKPQAPVEEFKRLSAGAETVQADTTALVKPGTKGTKGRPIMVEANHFQLSLGKLGKYPIVTHYDVAFKPETPKRLLRPALEAFRNTHFPNRNPAFDGRKNMYSVSDLPFIDEIEGEVTVRDEEGSKTYFITVKKVNEIDLNVLSDPRNTLAEIQNAIQCVDIVLRSAPVSYCIPVGRSFFTRPEQRIITLGNGMQMYTGFYQTAVRGWKMLLNVDVAHKAFPTAQEVTKAVIEVLDDWCHQASEKLLERSLSLDQAKTVEKFLRTLKVSYEIPKMPGSKRVHRINGLGEPASRARFKIDGRSMTVQEYFAKEKNYRLRYPEMPTLWVGSAQRKEGERILLPMELCYILPDQAVPRKMNEEQTSNMIKVAATNTDVRKDKIMRSIHGANYNANPIIREFGFNVGTEFEKINARVLDPPELAYGNRAVVRVQKGVWRADRYQFIQPAQLSRWTIVSADRRRPLSETDCRDFVSRIKQIGQNNGINIAGDPEKPYKHITNDSLDGIRRFFKDMQGYDLIIVVVPNSGPVYSHVKSAAEISVGCLTQCIKMNTLQRKGGDPSTIGNILLKINSKLNGMNHHLYRQPLCLTSEPVMIMGADVTHPSPDAQNIPSVAAVTASLDPRAFKYKICWRLQGPRVEIIGDLQNITRDMLLTFYKANRGCKPQKIIFFRDGVSEGQFEDVRRAEIAAIQRACTSLQAEYQPKITFLVVQKRHHTRLFPYDKRDSYDRNFNVPAGTLVDHTITHPVMQDFYLVSHASIQGVAKPTKYCTIYDDNDFDHDTIEELTYHLCHMFARCNRSVSYPAPTYYAHLAAARAKVYIENHNLDMNNLDKEQERFKTLDKIRVESPMFFV